MPDIEISRWAIQAWIKTIATGEFHYKNILGLERVLTPREDDKLRKIIYELCQAGVCETVGRRDGFYRPVEDGVAPIDFAVLRPRDFPVVLPFGLRQYVFIFSLLSATVL